MTILGVNGKPLVRERPAIESRKGQQQELTREVQHLLGMAGHMRMFMQQILGAQQLRHCIETGQFPIRVVNGIQVKAAVEDMQKDIIGMELQAVAAFCEVLGLAMEHLQRIGAVPREDAKEGARQLRLMLQEETDKKGPEGTGPDQNEPEPEGSE